MKQRVIKLIFFLLCVALPIQAQNAALLAFINGSGQLIITNTDGNLRWIATNPGEQLHPTLGYNWSPDGSRIFYGVQSGASISLRIGAVATQTSLEVAQVNTPVFGGAWVDASQVRVVSATGDVIYRVDGASSVAGVFEAIMSPFDTAQPHLINAQAISPTGNFVFGLLNSEYVISRAGNLDTLGILNDATARNSGLWSGDWVAYWGTDSATGQLTLAVTNAVSAQTSRLSGQNSTPLQPITWLPDSTQLIYRNPAGQLRVADFACLQNGCTADPFESGLDILPASASDVQVVGETLYFRDNTQIKALDIGCIADNTCLSSALTLGDNVAPRTIVHVIENTLVYTAFSQDAANPADRMVMQLDTTCLPDSCIPQLVLPDAIAGLLAPDGGHLVVNVLNDGLYMLQLSDLNQVFLADVNGNEALLQARWQR